jgi:hypothetical protein
MATDHNPSGRRPHYHRSRRGVDRRGSDRRALQQGSEQGARPPADHVDVEQIMREIRTRISQRHGIELSTQQIQDLAARRLEAILDPRTVSPTLMDQLRKGAAVPDPQPATSSDMGREFTDEAIYESDNVVLRFFRRLLRPLLTLFFNPAPIAAALRAQARVSRETAARAAEGERRQTEWNALHYQILQRLVTEVSRVSIEMQALGTRTESLAARVDFNDRRVRSFEAAASNRSPRPQEIAPAPAPTVEVATVGDSATPATATAATSDGPRRRRRRRRGRRGSASATEQTAVPAAAASVELPDETEIDEGDEEAAAESAIADSPANDDPQPRVELPDDSPTPTPVVLEPTGLPAEQPEDAPATTDPAIPAPAPFSLMPQPIATPESPQPPAPAPPEPAEPGSSES